MENSMNGKTMINKFLPIKLNICILARPWWHFTQVDSIFDGKAGVIKSFYHIIFKLFENNLGLLKENYGKVLFLLHQMNYTKGMELKLTLNKLRLT
jgi:hypothetical protein